MLGELARGRADAGHPSYALSLRGHGESPGRLRTARLSQYVDEYQLLMHRPARAPLGAPPVLVLATPDDRLVPIRGVRATAARYGAHLEEFPGMGHDLMLDARWREPLQAMLTWLAALR